MTHRDLKQCKRLIYVLILAAGILNLTGCATTTIPAQTTTPGDAYGSQPANRYISGTVFVYASGRWDRVQSVNGENVEWINHRGHSSVSSHDFTFRPIRWTSGTHEGTRYFDPAEFLFSSKAFSLWPLSVGKTSGYYENNVWHAFAEPYRTYKAYWSCKVEAKAKVTVPAGSFDTFKIVCVRYSGRLPSSHTFSREYRTWYYAPEIKHWVAYERDYRGENSRKTSERLASVIPALDRAEGGEADRLEIEQFFQETLNSSPDLETSVWQSATVPVQMELTPVKTFQNNARATCRQYRQTLHMGESKEKYYSIACRGIDEKWEIPKR